MFFRRDSGLWFDAVNFDGFHMHVEDLCMQAHAKGIPVLVPPASASTSCSTPFAGKVGYRLPDVQKAVAREVERREDCNNNGRGEMKKRKNPAAGMAIAE